MPRSSESLPIIIDTQEISHGHPWRFPVSKSTVSTANLIPHGCDYTVRGYTGLIGVERKSHGDYIRCIAQDWRRFTRQLEKLEKNRYAAVIVEGHIDDYIIYSSIGHDYVAYRTAQIASRGIPVIFCGSKELAAKCCWDFFKHSTRRVKRETEICDE